MAAAKVSVVLLTLGLLAAICLFQAPSAVFEGRIQPHLRRLTDAEVAVEATGRCTSADEDAMHEMGGGNRGGSFPKALSDCGKSAYSWFHFSQSSMKSCVERKTRVSGSCAQCFVAAGQYSVDHCKLHCLFGTWCSSLCLDCTKPSLDGPTGVKACAGVSVPEVKQC